MRKIVPATGAFAELLAADRDREPDWFGSSGEMAVPRPPEPVPPPPEPFRIEPFDGSSFTDPPEPEPPPLERPAIPKPPWAQPDLALHEEAPSRYPPPAREPS